MSLVDDVLRMPKPRDPSGPLGCLSTDTDDSRRITSFSGLGVDTAEPAAVAVPAAAAVDTGFSATPDVDPIKEVLAEADGVAVMGGRSSARATSLISTALYFCVRGL